MFTCKHSDACIEFERCVTLGFQQDTSDSDEDDDKTDTSDSEDEDDDESSGSTDSDDDEEDDEVNYALIKFYKISFLISAGVHSFQMLT